MSNAADARSGSGRKAAPHGAADWLCLAAAPTFATMALLTGVFGGRHTDMLCMSVQGASLFGSMVGGMVPMYLLMSAFHAGPWLRLIAGRRGGGGP